MPREHLGNLFKRHLEFCLAESRQTSDAFARMLDKLPSMQDEVLHLIEAWHWMYFETDLVLGGIQSEHLHRRPALNLLSISEHLAHVARSEASIIFRYLAGVEPHEWPASPLTSERYGWPPTMLEEPLHSELSAMSLGEITDEYLRCHDQCYQLAKGLDLSADTSFSDSWDRVTTVRDRLRIAAYHVAYHHGQIYTVRHLLGEETPEN